MTVENHNALASFIWDICNLLRGPYKRNEYRKVILPLTVLRRFDCLLAPAKEKSLAKFTKVKDKPEKYIEKEMREITGFPFYNSSPLDFKKLLDDPNHISRALSGYINRFSPNIRTIMEKFAFDVQIQKMADKNLLFNVIKKFAAIDLSQERVDNIQMGYIFEELIRIGAEQSNEEAGEHFTPREVIHLLVDCLLTEEGDIYKAGIVKAIYDPACGTGGMLTGAEEFIRSANKKARPKLFGQDLNDEAWAVCKSDILIKGAASEDENIFLGDSLTDQDGFKGWKFDYMLANPPFGVTWEQQKNKISAEHLNLGFAGRYGAGLPRINDGSLLFLQHMISKMRPVKEGGSRIGIVFNGSPMFSGDAGSGESEIRKWIIENDYLDAIVALPDQLFYNTGIFTFIWLLTNRKEARRKGKVLLVDARQFYIKMRKSLGNKRNEIGDGKDGKPDQISEIVKLYGEYKNGAKRKINTDGVVREEVVARVFDNEDFGFQKITVERPLRLNFAANEERIARLEEESGFIKLATSKQKNPKKAEAEIEEGRERQIEIRKFLNAFARETKGRLFKDRQDFAEILIGFQKKQKINLSTPEIRFILNALGERDETAEICLLADGSPEPDPELRDTENVPLKEKIEAYFKREVIPHAPDAWIDESKTKIGYEIPFNRHFFKYVPPRDLSAIEADLRKVEQDIVKLLKEVTE